MPKNKLTKILLIIVIIISVFALFEIIVIGLLSIIKILFSGNTCSIEKLESVASPNQEYKFVTYRENCGATIDFSVIGELCTKDKCIEIYDCYHEKDSYVYWIDNKTVSINNKILNITKEKYSWKKDENYQEHLYKK